MEKFKALEIENLNYFLGGEFWETGCDSQGRPTDVWDDATERMVYFHY